MTTLLRIATILVFALQSTQGSGINPSKILSQGSKVEPFKVEILGEGKPTFYLPGFTTPGSVWKETIQNLKLGRKSYLFSYAGFNGNTPIEMPWYSAIKNSIIEYIENNQLTDLILIGHSMGGNLAVEIAARFPDRVSKLVIVDALACMREVMMPNVPAEALYYDSPYNQQMLNMEQQEFKNMASMMASNMTYDSSKKNLLSNWILEADRETWVYGYTDLLKLDLRDELGKIQSKTLILGASYPDVEVAKKHFEQQYFNLANKTIKMAPKSKHFIMFDQPNWLYDTTREFLSNE